MNQRRRKPTANRKSARAQALLRRAIELIAQGHGLARYALTTLPPPKAGKLRRMEKREIPYSIAANIHRQVDHADNDLQCGLASLEHAVTNTDATLYRDWESFRRAD